MSTAAMVTYAYDQIDQAGPALNVVSKQTLSSRPHMMVSKLCVGDGTAM